ncbi:hypothetical protein M2323_002330 [Rhodoblastus acidophilus]|uniref:YdhR family protein n=1 Tax=Rhodoblastus acidophilus TaxID=1074 RepID=UPI0022241E40|nr:YdhR family protein [Rhodoblastus acidophilus]MCW2285781.1 hypothetical protein [Rhodoblastus acidophilus]MCW2333396.1 hypothetical protein [Rhodoblastus acidophilus]
MIVTHVKFALSKPMTLEEAKTKFEGTAPKYRGREGLLRKTYLLSEDGLTAGAVYFWGDRAAAERLYTEAWRETVTQVYGVAPEISFYHAPVTVENA